MSIDYLSREDDLGKVYDSRLMRRLYRYAKPYTKWLLLALFLAALMSGSQILLPYLSKIGIDSYIVVKGRLLDLSDIPEENRNTLINKYGDDLARISATVFVIGEGVMDPADALHLDRSGAIRKGSYYLMDLTRYSDDVRVMLSQAVNTGQISSIATETPEKFYLDTRMLNELSDDMRSAIRKPDRNSIHNIALIYLGILIVSLFIMFFEVYVMAWVGQRIMFDIRMELFDHIQTTEYPVF